MEGKRIQKIKLKWDYRILAISTTLMFIGAIFPTILPKHGIDSIVSVIFGATVSILGNLVLIYVTESKLVTTGTIHKLS